MYLYGASGHAKVIIDILCAQGSQVEGLIDDNSEIRELHGYPVFHGRSDLFPLIISIGDNRIRRMISQHMQGYLVKPFIHRLSYRLRLRLVRALSLCRERSCKLMLK